MRTAGIGRLAGFSVVGLLGLGVLAVPAASAQTAPPTLTGEQVRNSPGVSGNALCATAGPFSFTIAGTATGPYPGTFSETVSGTVSDATSPRTLGTYTASFTITSATGNVTGTAKLSDDSFDTPCYYDAGNFSISGNSVYQATIQAAGETYADQGTTFFDWTEGSGVPEGDDNFTSSLSQVTPVTVNTATAVTSSAAPSVPGQAVTYTATVSPVPSGGTVAFTDGTTTIAGCGTVAVNTSTGKATCPVTYTAAGSHTITGAYSGAAGYAASTSAPLTENVVANKADLKMKLTVSTVAAGAGEVTVTETVTVTNQGPATASKIATVLTQPGPGRLKATNADGASVHGSLLTWNTPSLASGSSLTFTVVATAAHAKGTVPVTAGTLSATRDPNLLNNAALVLKRLG